MGVRSVEYTAALIFFVVFIACNVRLKDVDDIVAKSSFQSLPKSPADLVERKGNRFKFVPGIWDFTREVIIGPNTTCAEEGKYPFTGRHGCCSEKGDHNQTVRFSRGLETSEAVLHFLSTIRNRRVLLLGDSLTLQNFAGFLMIFKSQGITMIPRDDLRFKNTQYVYFPESNATMRLVEFYRFADVARTATAHVKPDDPEGYILQGSMLNAVLSESDTVVANIGLHYSYDSDYQSRMMHYLQNMITQGYETICFLWRSTLPQHFATKNGTGLYSDHILGRNDCPALEQPWRHGSDAILAHVRAGSPTPLIDMTSLLEGASVFHSLQVGDCSHFCYSPYLFSPMLTLVGEAIRQSC